MLVHDPRSQGTPARLEEKKQGTASAQLAGKRALIVEDDLILSRFLDRLLCAEGMQVETAYTGADGIEALRPGLDLVVLDLNLPEIDGIGVLQHLRQNLPQLSVFVLTGRSRSESAVLALENGADDCLTKPFAYTELLARVRALLRRKPAPAAAREVGPELVLNEAEFSATRYGERTDLSPREFGLLAFLMRTPGVPVSRNMLLQALWGDDTSPSSNVVDVYMKYVRDKMDRPGMPKLIRTVRGIGYVLDLEPASTSAPLSHATQG